MSDISNNLLKEFTEHLTPITEEVGRGRAMVPAFGGASNLLKDISKYISYDIMNKSSHRFMGADAKYEFSNFYTLDIRNNIAKMSEKWRDGAPDYQGIFNSLYTDKLADQLLARLQLEYKRYYDDYQFKRQSTGKDVPDNTPPDHDSALLDAYIIGGPVTEEFQTGITNLAGLLPRKFQPKDTPVVNTNEPHPNTPKYDEVWKDLQSALKSDYMINALYDRLNPINIFVAEGGKEYLAIKKDGFVPHIMDGLASAVVGHVPQGVTIEEMLSGKFTKKPMTADQETFINKVKDPTSDKEFDFRSWNSKTLKDLHTLIMTTFKYGGGKLEQRIPGIRSTFEASLDPKRKDLLLYLTQDDFHRVEKGGKGLGDLTKKGLKAVGQEFWNTAEIPDM